MNIPIKLDKKVVEAFYLDKAKSLVHHHINKTILEIEIKDMETKYGFKGQNSLLNEIHARPYPDGFLEKLKKIPEANRGRVADPRITKEEDAYLDKFDSLSITKTYISMNSKPITMLKEFNIVILIDTFKTIHINDKKDGIVYYTTNNSNYVKYIEESNYHPLNNAWQFKTLKDTEDKIQFLSKSNNYYIIDQNGNIIKKYDNIIHDYNEKVLYNMPA